MNSTALADAIFFFEWFNLGSMVQAENDAVGREFQRQLEAVGKSFIAWILFFQTWK